MTITQFLGDGDYAFALPFDSIVELQRVTGASFGVLTQRVRTMAFDIRDLSEIIRLALIGGGMQPKAAFELTQTYVVNRPIAETLPIALSIIEAVWLGAPVGQDGGANG